jgi:polysaccharide transporter, PST family
MINRLKVFIIKALKSKDGKILFSNFVSLSILQALNLLLPLITLPYLVRVIGAEKFGVIAFASSFVIYFQSITDYGFSLTGTREIAINRDDPVILSKIFSRIITIKSIFLILTFTIFCTAIFCFKRFENYEIVFLFSFITIAGNVFFPDWFFQGMEKMEFITLFNFISKLLFTILLFVLIKRNEDYIFVPLITSMGFFVAGVGAFFYAIQKFNIHIKLPTFKEIVQEIKSGIYVFISMFLPNLYYNSSIFFLGIFGTHLSVALFSAAQRIISLSLSFIEVFSRTFFPYLNRNISKYKSFERLILSLGILLSIGIAIFSKLIINVLFSSEFSSSVYILLILSISPFLNSIMYCYGTNYLLTMHQDKVLMKIIMYVSVIGFLTTLIMIKLLDHWGAAINLVLIWIIRSILTFRAAQKHRKQLIK